MALSGPPTLSGRRAARAELDAAIGAWTATRERDDVVALLPKLENAVELWMREGIERAMNAHNRRDRETD
jgi:hypothetical protein